jgi:hypothetical protein
MQGLYDSNSDNNEKARKLVKALIYQEQGAFNELKTYEIFSALFLKTNKSLLRGMRHAFRDEFKELCETLNKKDSNLSEAQKNSLLNKHLCLLPLSSIKPGHDIYDIPEYNSISDKWELVSYSVSAIELTPTSGFRALTLTDSDRQFAYALNPIEKSKTNFKPQPHLIFMDPQYPTNQAYFTKLFRYVQSITGIYNQGKDKLINKWLKDSTKLAGTKARLHGMGVTGSDAYMTTFDEENANYISRVDVYGARRLCDTLFTNYQNKWQNIQEKPEIHVQLAKNHYNLGNMLENWHVSDASDRNITETEYYKGFWYNLVVGKILGNILNGLLALPCHYLIIPLCRTVLNHKMELALMSALIMIFMMLPGLVMTASGVAVTVFAAAYFEYKLIEPMRILLNLNEKSEPLCHEPDTHDLISRDEATRLAI